jgi:hypothetical protein
MDLNFRNEPDQKWYWVEWKQRPEPKPQVLEHNETQVHEFETRKRREMDAHQENKNKWRYEGLQTTRQKQGLYKNCTDTTYAHNLGEPVRNKLVTVRATVNPHTDIHGTGRTEVTIRSILRRDKYHGTREVETTCIHDADGATRYTLGTDRAAILYTAYQHKANKQGDESYTEAIAALLNRYQDGAHIGQTGRKVKLTNHWATPPKIYDTLRKHMQATKERFASPLNYHTGFEYYWAAHKEDTRFGALWDTYKNAWTG